MGDMARFEIGIVSYREADYSIRAAIKSGKHYVEINKHFIGDPRSDHRLLIPAEILGDLAEVIETAKKWLDDDELRFTPSDRNTSPVHTKLRRCPMGRPACAAPLHIACADCIDGEVEAAERAARWDPNP